MLCINGVDIHSIGYIEFIFSIVLMYVDTVDTRHNLRISNAFNAIYVNTVNTKDIHIFAFLIFDQFSIWLKFWKAQTEGFSTIPSNTISLDIVDTGISISNVFNVIYVNTFDTEFILFSIVDLLRYVDTDDIHSITVLIVYKPCKQLEWSHCMYTQIRWCYSGFIL